MKINAKTSLVNWVMGFNSLHTHVNDLLKRPNNNAKLKFLPLDWKTLMLSKRVKVNFIDMPPDKYQRVQVETVLNAILVAMEAKGMPILDDMMNITFMVFCYRTATPVSSFQ